MDLFLAESAHALQQRALAGTLQDAVRRCLKSDSARIAGLEYFRMPFVDITTLDVTERLPGWHGRYFHTASMTIAHYDFKRGSSIHEHFHPQEEVYEVIEGELEVTIDGVAEIARSGLVAIVPSNARHSVKALTDGRAIIVDYPARRDFV